MMGMLGSFCVFFDVINVVVEMVKMFVIKLLVVVVVENVFLVQGDDVFVVVQGVIYLMQCDDYGDVVVLIDVVQGVYYDVGGFWVQ